jgi:hypothetical protein
MAAVNAQRLAVGYLPSTQGEILAAVTRTTIIPPRSIVLHNENAAAQTVILYLKSGGVAYPVDRGLLEQFWMGFSSARLVLESGDSLEAVTTTASAVKFIVSGGEEV